MKLNVIRGFQRDIIHKLHLRAKLPPPFAAMERTAIAAIRARIKELALLDRLTKEDAAMHARFPECFPADIPHYDHLLDTVYHRIHLQEVNRLISCHTYSCPKQHHDAWLSLLTGHLAAGHIRPSSSSFASPCFLIPKANPTDPPCWVNDYCLLNDNTIPDVHPLPTV